jgi:hypothetical protein
MVCIPLTRTHHFLYGAATINFTSGFYVSLNYNHL